MGKLEDDVKELILDNYRSLAEFARSIDIPEHTLYSALNNGLSGATLTTVAPIAKALDLDILKIAEGKLSPRSNTRHSALVPLFGTIAAGAPSDPGEAEDLFPIPAELHDAYPDSFLLRIEGSSMNLVLPDGSLALVDPRDAVDASGGLYAVRIGESAATVKRVRLLDNGLLLQPESDDPTYHPIVFDRADPDAPLVSVIGRVVWHCPPFDWQTHPDASASISVRRTTRTR